MEITKIEVHVVGPEDERYTWSEDIEEVYQSNTIIRIFTDEDIDPSWEAAASFDPDWNEDSLGWDW